MGKRGPKPKGKVKIKWSPQFAYAIGLLATDGNLSPNGRHLHMTSKDREIIDNFQKALGIRVHVGKKASGSVQEKKYFVVQFGDVLFYQFLLSIGLMPNKSKIIGEVTVPSEFFFDFLRGCFDGDGCTYSYWDPRWSSSFMFYTVFACASKRHVLWLQKEVRRHIGIQGHITGMGAKGTAYQLKYAKTDSVKLLRRMYYRKSTPSLSRKKLKIQEMLAIIGERL